MAYMSRVGTQGYQSMPELIEVLMKAGLGASELFSCSLKAAGIYMGRCCASFYGSMQSGLTSSCW